MEDIHNMMIQYPATFIFCHAQTANVAFVVRLTVFNSLFINSTISAVFAIPTDKSGPFHVFTFLGKKALSVRAEMNYP